MTIEKIIEKATEGGWRDGSLIYKNIVCSTITFDEHGVEREIDLFKILSELLFWKSLGKALGWKDSKIGQHYDVINNGGYYGGLKEVKATSGHLCYPACPEDEWLKMWHNFIDHLAEGKSAESYFKEL